MENSNFKEKYSKLIEKIIHDTSVTQAKKSGFGSGLRVNGKVFAMPVKEKLVVKLPLERIEELVSSQKGEFYEYGGKIAKGWFVIGSEDMWESLLNESLKYIKSKAD